MTKVVELVNYLTRRCPECLRLYKYLEGTKPFPTCGRFDCTHKYLHPELKEKEVRIG